MEEKFMKEALKQAKKAASIGETPIGAVIVHEGTTSVKPRKTLYFTPKL